MALFKKRKNRIRRRVANQIVSKRLARLEALEDRRVLAAVVLSGAQLRVFGNNGVDNAIEVSFDTGTGRYSIADSAAPISAGGFTDFNADPNVVEINPDENGVVNNLRFFSSTGDDSVTVNSYRDGDGLRVDDISGQGTDTININGAVGSAGTPAAAQVILDSEVVNLAADIITAGQTVTLRAANGTGTATVNVTASTTIDTGNTPAPSLVVDGNIEGPSDLNVQTGIVDIRGTVGAVTAPASVDLTGEDQILIEGNVSAGGVILDGVNRISAGGSIEATTGEANLESIAIDLTAPGTATVTGNTNVVVSGPITGSGANSLELTATTGNVNVDNGDITIAGGSATISAAAGAVDLDDNVIAEGIVITSSTGAALGNLDGNAGGVTVNGPATLSEAPSPVLINTTGAVDLDAVDGAGNAVNIREATTVTLDEPVTNVGPLSIGVASAPITQVNINANVTAGNVSVFATATDLDGDVTAQDDDVVFNGDLNLIGDVELRSGEGAGDNVEIRGNVTGGGNSLEMRAGEGEAQVLPFATSTVTGVSSFLAHAATIFTGDITTTGGDIIFEFDNLNVSSATMDTTGSVIFRNRVNGSDLTVGQPDLPTFSANVTGVEFGDADTGRLTIEGDGNQATSIDFSGINGIIRMIAEDIDIQERLNNGTNTVELRGGDTIEFNDNGLTLGTGDLRIVSLPGTLNVGGARPIRPQPAFPWGQFELIVAGDGDVTFVNEVSGIGQFTAEPSVSSVRMNNPTALDTNNGINIQTDLEIAAGLEVVAGNINVSGTTTMTGPGNILGAAGSNVTLGNVDAGGQSLQIRETAIGGGGLGAVSVGDVTNVNRFTVRDSAASLAVQDITANNIQIGSGATTLDGDLVANNGILFINGGAVTLAGNSSLTNNSANANLFTQVNGTIDGGFDLTVESGVGRAIFASAIGAGTALANMTVNSSGSTVIVSPITVTSNFSWTVGDEPNAGADILKVNAIVTAGNQIDLEADLVLNEVIGVNLVAPTVNVIENGAP